MQAFALKKILENMTGAEVFVINKKRPSTTKQRIKFFVKKMARMIFKGEYVKFTPESDYKYRSQNTEGFVYKYLNFTVPIYSSRDLINYINTNFDVVIVGSDQVWRLSYVHNIYDYFFKGVSNKILKIAYAASFGTNKCDIQEMKKRECAKLLRDFSLISVREDSAIKLMEENFGCTPKCYLDPTFLLPKEEYEKLLCRGTIRNSGYCFTYILNDSDDKDCLVKFVEEALDLEIYKFNTKAENPKVKIKCRVAPSVIDWLSGLYFSDFVVTDSFHGCVFSIIFNKPFIVYGNNKRGIDRFTSILNKFSLSDRLLYSSDSFSSSIISKRIEWVYINKLINKDRNEILKELKVTILH